jgi:hypothetical protein
LAANACGQWTEKVRDLVEPGGEDHRSRQWERESRSLLVIQPSNESGHHRDPRPTDTGEKGERLEQPDDERFAELERLESPGRGLDWRGT